MTPTLKTGPLDQFERTVRVVLGIALVLLAWGFGWSDVEAIGALLLGIVALVTAAVAYSPTDRVMAGLRR
jgi:glucose-6-phosphate-specific signal transduction histidine kinase